MRVALTNTRSVAQRIPLPLGEVPSAAMGVRAQEVAAGMSCLGVAWSTSYPPISGRGGQDERRLQMRTPHRADVAR